MQFRFIRTLFFAVVMLCMSAASFAQIGISISFAPPELPVYEQPICPGDGYLWTPGYWAYANDYDDYYWVPGTWVMAPEVGLLWTPAYWGWGGNGYVFYDGYWGQQVGFYGGVSYGYGYYGNGYEGGRWDNGHFFYNRSVNNVNVTVIHNVYNTTVINSTVVNRVSYNGGNGGISVRATAQQEAVGRERHIPAVAVQTEHAQAAHTNPEQRASINHGKPAVAATPKPGAFSDRAIVPAKAAGAPYNPPVKRAAAEPVANTPAAQSGKQCRSPGANNNQPESKRPAMAQPNVRPEPSRPEANRPEANRPASTAAARPDLRPNRNNEPAQRAPTPTPAERSQPQRESPPPAEARRQRQNNSASSRLREHRKKRNAKPSSRSETKSHHNKDRVWLGFTWKATLGYPAYRRVPFFRPEMALRRLFSVPSENIGLFVVNSEQLYRYFCALMRSCNERN